MMPSLPVCVRLSHEIAFSHHGNRTVLPSGTAVDWLAVVNIFSPSALVLVSSQPYESLKIGGLQYFTWCGKSVTLRVNQPLTVVALCNAGALLLMPLTEVMQAAGDHTGTGWERHVAVLAWQQGLLAEKIEVIEPLVVDGN